MVFCLSVSILVSFTLLNVAFNVALPQHHLQHYTGCCVSATCFATLFIAEFGWKLMAGRRIDRLRAALGVK